MGKSYFQIDPKIQRLVTCMNTCGMKTFASCQGHGLAPVNPHHHWYRYWRKTLDKDFKKLCLLIKYSAH